MSRKQRLFVWGVGFLLFVGAFVVTLGALWPSEKRGPSSQDKGTVITEGAEVVLRYVAEQGDEVRVEVIRAGEELIGLSVAELAAARPRWSIQSFTADRIVADVPCDPETPGGFLRSKEGKVAIYDGDPGGCYRLRELTEVRLDDVSAPARQALDDGISFEDEAEIPLILEGLQREI